MTSYLFFDDEIKEAKRIRAEEDKLPGQQRFVKGERWTGKLGQWAVERHWPSLLLIGGDFNYSTYDFTNRYLPKTGRKLIYEAKTKNGKSPYRETFQFDVNDEQFRKNKNDIYIGCYWQLEGENLLVIAGWLWKKDIDPLSGGLGLGRFMRKGELFLDKYPVETDRWDVDFSKMNDIDTLPI